MKQVKCWKFGKWAWRYKECKICGNNKKNWANRHKGNGLCIKCYDRKRGKNPKRKEYKKQASKRWQQRFFADPAHFEINRKYAEKWRKESKRYRYWLTEIEYRKRKYKYYLTKARRKNLKRWMNGIEILVDGQRVKTPIMAGNGTESDDTPWKVELFKQVYRKVYENR